ncbi:MAG: hypothetical protein FWE36_08275, partial [Erysipelotrichales bacterium]|nr:hypothetical protein [Erysipelotrichales bacterium]
NMFQETDTLKASDLNEIVKELLFISEEFNAKYGRDFIMMVKSGRSVSLTRTNASLNSASFTLALPVVRAFARVQQASSFIDVSINNNSDNISITVSETKALYQNELYDNGEHEFVIPIEFSWDQNFTEIFGQNNITVNYSSSPRSINFLRENEIIEWTRRGNRQLNQHSFTLNTRDFTKLNVFAAAEIPSNATNRIGVSVNKNENNLTINVNELEALNGDWTLTNRQHFTVPINFFRDSLQGTLIGRSSITISYEPSNFFQFFSDSDFTNWTRFNVLNTRTFRIPTNGRSLFAQIDDSQVRNRISVTQSLSTSHLDITITELENLQNDWTLSGLQAFSILVTFRPNQGHFQIISQENINIDYLATQVFIDFLRGRGPIDWVRRANRLSHSQTFNVPLSTNRAFAQRSVSCPYRQYIDTNIRNDANNIGISFSDSFSLRNNASITGAQEYHVLIDFFRNANFTELIGQSRMTVYYYAAPINPID